MTSGAARQEAGVLAVCTSMLRPALRRWRGLVGVSMTMGADAVINVAKPWPLAIIVNDVLSGGRLSRWEAALIGPTSRGSLLAWALGATVILFVAGWAVGVAGTYAQIAYGQRLSYDLAERLLAHLQRLSLGTHSRRTVGDTIRRVTSDCGCVTTIVVDGLLPAGTAVISLVLMITIMVRLDSSLALLALAVLPLLVICIRRYGDQMSGRGYELEEEESALYDHVEQTLSAIAAVQAFSAESRAGEQMRSASDRVFGAALAQVDAGLRFKILTSLVMALGMAAAFWVGGRQAMSGRLTTGTIIVFASYLYSLYQPLESVMYTTSTVQAAVGSARRVSEVLAVEPEVGDVPGAVPLPAVRGRLVFEHVSFSYDPDRPVLEDVSFEVEAGQVVAIVGSTGAGKSTLAGLVPRFYDPSRGRVLVDGHDVRSVHLASLRSQVSVVLQESFLFPVSIAENIAYGRPDATRSDVVAAAQAADLDEFVARLPDGYETVVGERGATLSGGERQRVAIARALLKDAPLLVLDEPTSALDAGTESRVLGALDRLMVGRTTLVIAHRLSTVRAADVIVVLSGGRVAEQGSHDELLSADGLYARLHTLQYAGAAGSAAGQPGASAP